VVVRHTVFLLPQLSSDEICLQTKAVSKNSYAPADPGAEVEETITEEPFPQQPTEILKESEVIDSRLRSHQW